MRRRIFAWLTTCVFTLALLAPPSTLAWVCECSGQTVAFEPVVASCCGTEIATASTASIAERGCCDLRPARERTEAPSTAAVAHPLDFAPLLPDAPVAPVPLIRGMPVHHAAARTPCLRGPPGRHASLRAPPACS